MPRIKYTKHGKTYRFQPYSEEVKKIAVKLVRASARIDMPRWNGLFKEVCDRELGLRMAKFRHEHDVRQNDLSKHTRFRGAVICNLEKGRFRWTAEKVLAYIDGVITLSK